MYRSLLRRSKATNFECALSALTGNSYPPDMSAKLSALGFPSNLWLTEKQMKAFGVSVAPEHAGKGYRTETSDGVPFLLYNASQTSDPEKVQVMKGKYSVLNALTKERLRGGAESTLGTYADKFPSNEWISDRDVDILSLKLKADAVPVSVSYEFQDTVAAADGTITKESRTVTRGYYNISHIMDPTVIERARNVLPVSASSGRLYRGSAASTLLRASLDRGYTSPFWITMASVQALGLVINDVAAGVGISVTDNKVVTLFNASVTSNPSKIATAAYEAKYAPRSGMSGSQYPQPSQSQLSAIAKSKKYHSIYWLTAKQISSLGLTVKPGQDPTSITLDSGNIELYNADQTSGKNVIEARFGQK